MDNQQVNIQEGTISFWTKPNSLNFDNNQVIPILQLSPENGSIFMVKDADNKIKFFHLYLGKGRTDVDYDVSNLDKNIKHMFAVTWSVENKEIVLYIDGREVSKTNIKY